MKARGWPAGRRTGQGIPWPCVGFFGLWGLAFTLSCQLAALPANGRHGPADRSVIATLLGGTRVALSGYCYEQADAYFHRGVGHIQPEAFENGFLQRLARDISPRTHAHTTGEQVKEVMPWLDFAIRADPHNVEVYLVAVFWLATDAGRPDLALDLLHKAQRNNPFNYRIQLEKGRILLREHRVREAGEALAAGLAFWPGNESPDSEEARMNRVSLLLYRALIHESEGDREAAVKALRQIVVMYPDRVHIVRRIESLEAGTAPVLTASEYWKAALEQDQRQRQHASCGREDHDHDAHGDGHDH